MSVRPAGISSATGNFTGRSAVAEATSSAMIIGCLPPSVVLLIMVWTPTYMTPMFTDHRGWLMLGASAIWMAAGIFVMVRMINFKF